MLPDVFVAPESRLFATVKGGTGAGNPGSDVIVCSETPPATVQKALQAVPIHANPELYHMLRRMSKRTFSRKMFTNTIRYHLLRAGSVRRKTVLQLFYFVGTTLAFLAETALDLFPFCLSSLTCSVGAGVHLRLLEARKTGLSAPLPDRFQPAPAYNSCSILISIQHTRRSTMKHSDRNIHFQSVVHSAIKFEGREDSGIASQITRPQRLCFSTDSCANPENTSFITGRCSEKGCVFPASSPGSEKCVYHIHQQEEPVLFRSHQPTGLLLDPARMMPSEKEYDGSRKRDRRHMAAIWERFQNDGNS